MYQTGVEQLRGLRTTYTGLPWSDLLFGAPTSGTYSLPAHGWLAAERSFILCAGQLQTQQPADAEFGVRYGNILGWPWSEAHNKEYDFVPPYRRTALEQVGTQGVPASGLSGNNLNFAPRVGFAYRATNQTVFHAGYAFITRRQCHQFERIVGQCSSR